MEAETTSHCTTSPRMEPEGTGMCSSSGLCFTNEETEATGKGKTAKLSISTVYLALLSGWPFGGKGR